MSSIILNFLLTTFVKEKKVKMCHVYLTEYIQNTIILTSGSGHISMLNNHMCLLGCT